MNRELFVLFFAVFLSACSSGIKPINDSERSSAPKYVSQGYLDFVQSFDGCQSGDKVLVRNRQNNYFTCSETIPKLDQSKVVLLQKNLVGTTKGDVFMKTVVKHACTSGEKGQFTGLLSHLREYLYNTRKGPYTLVKQELLSYKDHRIVESGSDITYDISFPSDIDFKCLYKDADEIYFYGRDIAAGRL